MKKKLLLVIAGPTASGKSALALRTALEFNGEIVNGDSVQFYRGLDVGSAKPSPQEQAQVPHHLYSIVEPDQFYSAGRYMVEGRRTCRGILSGGRLPVVVGGTGLYLRALLEGLFEAPGRSETLRQRLGAIAQRRGTTCLYRMLEKKDPQAAQRIARGDRSRLIRALEIFFLTGEPMSRLQAQRTPDPFPAPGIDDFSVLRCGLSPVREILYARINNRVHRMFASGLLEEIDRLLAEGVSKKAKGFQALGYQHALACKEGLLKLEEAISLTARDTRRYAKRQLTWFRKDPAMRWIPYFGETSEAQQQLRSWIKEIAKDGI
ncbi:MAG: tRNA (adenosine(37)-N6)-dimethylallyltransferase MiaA [Acidobacteria bacterium]|nr:tRNA (adenosine(37)-N6)-dimethylallyltransferase MiaA [Acidobacteriota bacterium]